MVRILVIDDDPDFTLLVSELLRDHGWDTVVCQEELDALACILEHRPRLIVLDIRMTSRDSGWHLLEAFRHHSDVRGIPVIVCSAAIDDLQARAQWMQAHDISSLAKPFDVDALVSMVQDLLDKNGSPRGSSDGSVCRPH